MANNTNVHLKVNSEVNKELLDGLLSTFAKFYKDSRSQKVREGLAKMKKRKEDEEVHKNSFRIRTQSQAEVTFDTFSILDTYNRICRGQKIAMRMPKNKDRLMSIYTRYEKLKYQEIFSQISSLVFSNLLAKSKARSYVVKPKV